MKGKEKENTRQKVTMEDISEKEAVTPKEVGGHEMFNGRYAIVRWTLSGKTKVDEVKESLRESLPADVGMYGRMSRKRDEVRVVVRFQKKPHYTDVLNHLLLKRGSGQRVFLAKLKRPRRGSSLLRRAWSTSSVCKVEKCSGDRENSFRWEQGQLRKRSAKTATEEKKSLGQTMKMKKMETRMEKSRSKRCMWMHGEVGTEEIPCDN
jgi:hypothetical protein